MTLDRWWLFVATVFVISGTPGPNMLHVMVRASRVGFRRSGLAMAGCLSAVLLALGVGAILAAMPRLFDALRYAGAAYLIWLGIKAWRGAGESAAGLDPEVPMPAATLPARRLYRDALFTGLSNPKLILFASALFPQFMDRHAAQGPQFAILVATFAAIETSWYAVYAAGGQRMVGWLRRGARQRVFDRMTGGIFVAFGAGLVAARV